MPAGHNSSSPRARDPLLVQFLLRALSVTLAVIIFGTIATGDWLGVGVGAMIALVASILGLAPLRKIRAGAAIEVVPAVLGAMAMRMASALVLGGMAAATGWFDPVTLLVAVVVCHLALLIADTRYARDLSRTLDSTLDSTRAGATASEAKVSGLEQR